MNTGPLKKTSVAVRAFADAALRGDAFRSRNRPAEGPTLVGPRARDPFGPAALALDANLRRTPAAVKETAAGRVRPAGAPIVAPGADVSRLR